MKVKRRAKEIMREYVHVHWIFRMINDRLTSFFLQEGNGNSLQYSCLENSMDRGAW